MGGERVGAKVRVTLRKLGLGLGLRLVLGLELVLVVVSLNVRVVVTVLYHAALGGGGSGWAGVGHVLELGRLGMWDYQGAQPLYMVPAGGGVTRPNVFSSYDAFSVLL